MKKTNKHKQVDHPNGFDEGTSGHALCNECFAISNKIVRTKTDEHALAAGGAKWQAK